MRRISRHVLGGTDGRERGYQRRGDEVGDSIHHHDQTEVADGQEHATQWPADETAEVLIQADEGVRRHESVGVDELGQKRVLRRLEDRAE